MATRTTAKKAETKSTAAKKTAHVKRLLRRMQLLKL